MHDSLVIESEIMRRILLVATYINVELVGFLQFRSSCLLMLMNLVLVINNVLQMI
ncbi:MAG: hypothetical protein ACI8ZB_002758 [Desulforhopalus sp.]|jgi:hypothetical protein